jgi:hypothetical protein
MDNPTSSSVSRRFCTQDSPSGTPEKPELDISIKSTLDRFAHLGDTVAAKFLLPAAESERRSKNCEVFSPQRANLFENLEYIEALTKHAPEQARDLKLEITSQYVKQHMTFGTGRALPPLGAQQQRQLNFNQARLETPLHTMTAVADDGQPTSTTPTEAGSRSGITNLMQPLVSGTPRIKKKYKVRSKKNIDWKNVPVATFTSGTTQTAKHLFEDYLYNNYCNFLMKYSLARTSVALGTTQNKVYCCRLSNNKNDWGACFIRSNTTTDPNGNSLNVAYQISVSPNCMCKEYVRKQRGLPKSVVQNIKTLIETAPRIKPAQAKMTIFGGQMNIPNSQSNHKQRQVSGKQVIRAFGHLKKKAKKDGTIANNITHVYHLVGIKEKHTFELPDDTSKHIKTEEEVQRMATRLYDEGKLKVFATEGIDSVRTNVYRMMTVLDPTLDDTDTGTTDREKNLSHYINECIMKKVQQEKIEGSTYDTTTVISSVALLFNICMCEQLEWKLMASSDGTDNITSNNWQLLTFGVFNLNEHGVKSFRPFAFVLSPGERQETFGLCVLAVLKYARRLFGITDINIKAGAVSDCTEVFTNVYGIAFPNSKKEQCSTHILRKFRTGKGNGDYVKHVTRHTHFLRNVGLDDCRNLSLCLTDLQFKTYSDFVYDAWVAEGERKLANIFFRSYVNNPNFNNWHVACSGIQGYNPDNNPTERFMECIKGTRKFDGYMRIGYDVGTMIQRELPTMIYKCSQDRIGVESYTYLQQEEIIFHVHSKVYGGLTEYFQQYRSSIDCKVLPPNQLDTTQCASYLVNTEEYLGLAISNERRNNYDQALMGQTNFTYRDRGKYFECTSSLCNVTGRSVGGKIIYSGSCSTYWKTTYCNHAAIFQYHEKLKSYSLSIPTNRVKHGRQYNSLTNPRSKLKLQYMNTSALVEDVQKVVFQNRDLSENKIILEEILNVLIALPILINKRRRLDRMKFWQIYDMQDDSDKSFTLATDMSNIVGDWKDNKPTDRDLRRLLKYSREIELCYSRM